MYENYPRPQEAPQQPEPLKSEFLQRGRTEGKNDWWRYTIGVVIVFAANMIFSIPVALLIMRKMMHVDPASVDNATAAAMNPAILGVDPNLFLVLLLLGHVGAMIGLFVTVKYLHGKPFVSIITAAQRIRWKRVLYAGLVWFAFSGMFLAAAWIRDKENFVFTLDLKPFLITLLIGIVFLPFQTFWEEFMFRGYLMQGVAIRTKTAVLPIVATSILFGLMHAGNPEVSAYGFWYSMPVYILPGLLCAVIAVLDGGLEIPMGFHFANNLFGTIMVTNDSSAIQASTIFRQLQIDPRGDLFGLLLYPVFFLLFWLIYKWDFKKLYT